ncbi:putative cytokinetic ring protein SteA [Actinomyces vulturis]|uniref:putative cytokinetic ring protein SteA n=1 Tax=Actinomyces vulturis TaxID=1857645 RepID=UPI000834165E|nr:putative cytokinetic ring protein SteA [Actinomyces vulturis]
MRNLFRKQPACDPDRPSGAVKIDARTKNLVKRLNPGDIAVIDHCDLDRVAAESLVEAKVAAVLNAAPSVSGRYPNLGPGIIIDAGIPLIDDLGPDVMRLREGTHVIIVDDTILHVKDESMIAQGTRHSRESIDTLMESANEGLAIQMEAFAANTMEYMRKEADLLLNGIGMPQIKTDMRGRHVLVVVRGYNYKEDLQALRSYVREYKPIIIGVDGGADAVLGAGMHLDMVVGDMDSVTDKALRSGAEIIVHAYRDGHAPGLGRVEELGVEHTVFPAAGTSEDIAMLIADEAGAELIVAVGTHATLLEFLDKGRSGMSSTFLTRLKLGGKLIDAKGVSRLNRPRIRNWHLALLVAAGFFALFAALASTPAGQTFLGLSGVAWDDLLNFFRSLVGLAPNSPSV